MPAYTANPPVPPPNNIHRSWSDEQVPVTNYSNTPIHPAPRSSSFSASRAPQPDWRNNPPPPLPPLPPALLPGFHSSPPVAHSYLDFAFTNTPRRPPPPTQPRSGPYAGPDFPHTPSHPGLVQDSPPQWPPIDRTNNYFLPHSSFSGSPEPAAPRPTNNYVFNTPGLTDRPLVYAPAQSFRISDQSPSPPPAVPPRPITAHGEAMFGGSPPIPPQAISPPPIPPKTLASPITSRLMFPSRDDMQTSSSRDRVVSPSSDVQPVSEAQKIGSSEVSGASLPKAPEPGPLEVPETTPLDVPEPEPPRVPEAVFPEPGPPEVSGVGSPEVSGAGPEKGMHPFPSTTQATETPPLDSDFKRAMTLSLAESQRKKPVKKSQEEEEDDELARALAESLSLSTNLNQHIIYSPTDTFSSTKQTKLDVDSENSVRRAQQSDNASGIPRRRPSVPDSDLLSPEELEDHAAHGQIMQELEDEEVTRRLQEEEETRLEAELRERERQAEARARFDEALTKRLQEEEARRLEAERLERERQDEERARLDAELVRREHAEEKARKMIREAQERKDADMARRMAETEAERSRASKGSLAAQGAGPPAPVGPSPPQYTEVAGSPPPVPKGYKRPTARPVQSSPQLYNGQPQQTRRAASAHASEPAPPRPAEQADFARSASVSSGASVRRGDGNGSNAPHPASGQSRDATPAGGNAGAGPGAGPSRAGPGAGPSRAGPSAVPNAGRPRTSSSPGTGAGASATPRATSEDNAIGADVLKGVAYGFKPPDIQSSPSQSGALSVCPPFPEVISLFRSPSPPFHIMATSWRHLMRLLAQLETRIQANLEVIANSKEENLLRVVVQFVKLPYTANTWRTIVHLTLDQPVPRNVQNAWRFTNGDTTTLPYSYTLAPPLPYLVNNPQSMFYVIPLSATSPFPILPITLPNLALYLQSAIRDSRARKVQNDPSNGMRRLARMVMACYPEETIVPDKEERKPARGVGNLFKRVVGLGGTREDSSQGNEEVYDIITPFRLDQYTAS